MAFILLSAQLYIIDVGKIMNEAEANSLDDFVSAIELGSRHVVLGSLANISTGGQTSNLEANLQKWSSLISGQYHMGKSILSYELKDTTTYSSGIWIDWDVKSSGVSSACANFSYKLLDREAIVNHSYVVNLTTAIFVESSYRTMTNGDMKQVNVTISLLNEGVPALARHITIYYQLLDSWLIPDETDNYSIFDYGNGTYLASFTASISSPNVEVSTHILDQRGIYVRTNTTSTQI